MNILDLILNHDPQVAAAVGGALRLTPERRLICAVYAHQGGRYMTCRQ